VLVIVLVEGILIKVFSGSDNNNDLASAAVSNPMHGRLSHQNIRIITYAIGSRFVGSDEPKINDGGLIAAAREVL
jgi:hypothetical protein